MTMIPQTPKSRLWKAATAPRRGQEGLRAPAPEGKRSRAKGPRDDSGGIDAHGSRRTRAIVTAGVAILLVIFLLPFYWMVVLATHTQAEVFQFPPPLLPGGSILDSYHRLVSAFNFPLALWNSFFVAGSSTLLVLFFCSFAGYGFARFQRAPGHQWLFTAMMLTIMIPPTVGLVPWFVEMKNFGWLNTYRPLVVPGAANAFGIFWMRQYIQRAIPLEMYDAAKIDGSSDLQMYWQIVIPLIRSGLGALAMFTFLQSWTSYLLPLLILSDPGKQTLPLALATLVQQFSADTPAIMLGTTIGVIPVIVVFLLSARQFLGGLTVGAVK